MWTKGWRLSLLYMSNHKDECARRNAKLVANHLISDTCLNALKWPLRPAYTRWLIGNPGPWPTWVNKGLAKQWPPIICRSAPPAPAQTHGAPTPHAETKTELLSDRQQQGHMEGCCTESGITVTHSTRHTHASYIGYARACTQVTKAGVVA